LTIGEDQKIHFDKIFKCGSGQLIGVDIKPTKQIKQHFGNTCAMNSIQPSYGISEKASITQEVAFVANDKTKLSYITMHTRLGHANENAVKTTAKNMGIELTDGKEVRSDCAMGKSKQNNIPKLITKKATTKLERIGIDISYVNHESFGGAKY
jgi:hypothetical protein